MALLLADFGVADKVPRGGCFDDVLGTEVSDVALTSMENLFAYMFSILLNQWVNMKHGGMGF